MDGAGSSGFVGFSVNLLLLRQWHCFLRPSVFYQIFGNSMVWGRLSEAIAYRNAVLTAGSACPSITTLDGCQIHSNGRVKQPRVSADSSTIFPSVDAELSVFGEIPWADTLPVDLRVLARTKNATIDYLQHSQHVNFLSKELVSLHAALEQQISCFDRLKDEDDGSLQRPAKAPRL